MASFWCLGGCHGGLPGYCHTALGVCTLAFEKKAIFYGQFISGAPEVSGNFPDLQSTVPEIMLSYIVVVLYVLM